MRRAPRAEEAAEEVRTICRAFVLGLNAALGEKLYGAYMYGATVFEDGGRPGDIDCHVVLRSRPTKAERERLLALHDALARRFPPLGGEVDAWYVLLDDAKRPAPPQDRLRTGTRDEAWALHCAHVRAGRCVTLDGPQPIDIFPPPAWDDVAAALMHELEFVRASLEYAAYCVLNLCRIAHGFAERDVVVSKRSAAAWAAARFPEWAPLVEAAIRSYEGEATAEDDEMLSREVPRFLAFAAERIGAAGGV